MSSAASVRAVNRWASRIIPALLAGVVGFATYVVSKRVCVDYFLRYRHRSGTGIALLVLLFVFLVLVILTYIRLICVIVYNPGLEPRGQNAEPAKESTRPPAPGLQDDIEAQRYQGGPEGGHGGGGGYGGRDNDPNSPGLERFYSKNVFVCENDGLPRWCSSCRIWKPDRVHHSSEINRCVRKMDHYCPWVGGIISETSFKFFVQFVTYTAAFCVLCLVASVLCFRDRSRNNLSVDGCVIATIALASFFGLFTFGMSVLSIRYILLNLTNVEDLRQKSTVHQLAIRVPLSTEPGPQYYLISYPLPEPALKTPSSSSRDTANNPRDSLATRKFAVVKTQIGENPWDVGPYRNWVSVMGTNPFDWLFPIRHSPCVSGETNTSFYEMGPLHDELRTRYSLPALADEEHGAVTEMTEVRHAPGS
ncbi:DHHC palmitoyltransferase-domain-containing protein [Coniochaeta sp. 2T2.1]|nr:DHHC palmitoyltransferase-domain-containing protein [Coniochaeta sp. 2T2.1]